MVILEDYRALTIQEPWADLIANGKKSIELRKTNFTKELYPICIHAAKSINKEYEEAAKKYLFDEAHKGLVICKALIMKTIHYISYKQWKADSKKHLVERKKFYDDGYRYGYILIDVKPVKKMFKHKGNQGFSKIERKNLVKI